jgi:hypothetical protein
MNETTPPTESVETTVPAYKDRSVGLVIFGILTLLLGCLAGLFVLLMLVGQLAAARTTQMPASSVLPAIFIYLVLGVALIWLGIGSILARRWARALLLIFSWSWLVGGIIGLIAMGFFVPKVLANLPSTGTANQPAMPAGTMGVAMVVMFLFGGFFLFLLPAIWTFFYSSRHVKATCEMRDGASRWTDACPLPVLGFCLWLLFAVPWLAVMPLTGHGVFPFFEIFLTGVPGALLCFAIAALWIYAAWLMYHLKPQGWWLILIAMIVYMASSVMTFARHDEMEMYQLMGYPQAQIDQIQKMGLFTGNNMIWMMALSLLPFLGYLLFIKRYFRSAG